MLLTPAQRGSSKCPLLIEQLFRDSFYTSGSIIREYQKGGEGAMPSSMSDERLNTQWKIDEIIREALRTLVSLNRTRHAIARSTA